MEEDDAIRELLGAVKRIKAHAKAMPEMTGLEQAYGRGNVSTADYEAADALARSLAGSIAAELAGIERIASTHPAAFQAFLSERIALLDRIAAFLGGPAGRDHGFVVALLPDLREALVARFEGEKMQHGLDWALRVADDLIEEFGPRLPSR